MAGAFAYYRSRHDSAVLMSRAEVDALNADKRKQFLARREELKLAAATEESKLGAAATNAAEVEPPPA